VLNTFLNQNNFIRTQMTLKTIMYLLFKAIEKIRIIPG